MTKTTPRPRPRLLFPSAVLCALVLALFLAASAAAETRVGEATSPAEAGVPAEGDLIAASASYEPTTGTVSFTLTTAAAPGTSAEYSLFAELVTSPGLCSIPELGFNPFPAVAFRASYAQAEAEIYAGKEAESGSGSEHTGGLEGVGYGPKTVSGATTTLTETAAQLLNRPYNCALIGITRQKSGEETKSLKAPLLFPIAVKPPAPPTIITTPPATPASTPAPLLKPALAFPKTAPLTLGRERWTTVRFKVSNPGTAAVGPVTIKAKAPKGVRLEPATLKLPALLPGQTWPASFRIEVTDAAGARSKIALTATAAGLSAGGSVLVKPTG